MSEGDVQIPVFIERGLGPSEGVLRQVFKTGQVVLGQLLRSPVVTSSGASVVGEAWKFANRCIAAVLCACERVPNRLKF